MGENNAESLSKKRKYVRQRITKLCNKVQTNIENLSESERKIYTKDLYKLKEEVEDLNINIYSLKDESGEDSDINEDDAYNEIILATLGNLTESGKVSRGATANDDVVKRVNNQLKMPQVPLPKFGNARNRET